MDNEQILLDLYKQQQYEQTRSRLQKIFMIVSAAGSGIAFLGSVFYFVSILYTITFAGTMLCVILTALLAYYKQMKLNTACFLTMLYSCFIFVPPFWFLTGITGSAPYVSLIILVAMLSLYSGKTLKWLLSGYMLAVLALMVYSTLINPQKTEYAYTLLYNVAAYTIAIASIVLYLLFKQKEFNELNDKFLRNSFRDELTQLYNRKLLDLILEYQETQFRKEHKDYVLVMFDVDNFKEMNDTHGHIFGDIVLRSVAECISKTTRGSDFVVRYGGDEFLVIQPNASESSIQTFISRIEAMIESSCELELKLSISFGCAMRSECNTIQNVLKLADERLYKKKAEKKAKS